MRTALVIVLLASLSLLGACKKSGGDSQAKHLHIESGMQGVPAIEVEVTKSGSGTEANNGDHVYIHYVGRLQSGTKFDSSRDRGSPIDFDVGARQMIVGWDLIAAAMRVGDRWKCTIPPALAYGPGGNPPVIPRNATLVFDMELMSVDSK